MPYLMNSRLDCGISLNRSTSKRRRPLNSRKEFSIEEAARVVESRSLTHPVICFELLLEVFVVT